MEVKRKSALTGDEHTLDLPITPEQMKTYKTGNEPIEQCFPFLTDDQREFIETGIVKGEWETILQMEQDCSFPINRFIQKEEEL